MRDVAAEKGWPWLNAADQVPFVSGYRPTIAERGMVSSPHAAASQIGRDVLSRGGNAVDAAVATSAALMVTVPMQCSPGGDAFWLIGTPGQRPTVLNASGRSPRAADPEDLIGRGLTQVPSRSIWSATVPGAVRGWRDALARYGTRSLEELLAPAVKLATDGVFVSRHLRASIDIASSVLHRSALGRGVFLESGRPPELYSRICQPQLAETLAELGRTNGESIYTGRLAEALVSTVREHGGWLDADDLADHESTWQAPLELPGVGDHLYAPPPNSQGLILLEAIAIDRAAERDRDPRASTHTLIESFRAARADWEALSGPLAQQASSAGNLLADGNIEARARGIETDVALPVWNASRGHGRTGRRRDGDTANFVIVDHDRMVVSCTQSIFDDFGSGVAVEGDGYMLQSRGSSFSLDRGAPNELQPETLPPHSLSPGLRYLGADPETVFGAMGGSGQPQSQAQMLRNLAFADPAEAIAAPRWYIDFTESGHSSVMVESRIDPAVVAELEQRGHSVRRLGPWEDVMGHLQAIRIDMSGALIGAADPRSDGQAAGW